MVVSRYPAYRVSVVRLWSDDHTPNGAAAIAVRDTRRLFCIYGNRGGVWPQAKASRSAAYGGSHRRTTKNT